MLEKQLDLHTPDGAMTTFIAHPDRGGPHPLVIFYMDAPGIREELRDMARRYATAGYYVMLPNLYYRHGFLEFGPMPSPEEPERLEQLSGYVDATTTPPVMADTEALLAFAKEDSAVDHTRVGTVGYCLSGQFAINLAARHPQLVKAAASIYGTWLLTDSPDSPHLAARKAKAEMYFACAETDHWMPIEEARKFAEDLRVSGVTQADVEFFMGTEHGFAFPSRPAYDKQAAETHWERVLSLFERNLRCSTN